MKEQNCVISFAEIKLDIWELKVIERLLLNRLIFDFDPEIDLLREKIRRGIESIEK